MKVKVLKMASILCGLFTLYGCESYVINENFDQVIKSDDLPFKLKVIEDDEHNFALEKLDDNITIKVKDKFSASSGAIKISPNQKYKIKISLKNNSSDPVVICSFWKSVLSQSRQFIIAGKDGNPPTSNTQQQSSEWQTFEETFSTKPGDSFMVIRLLSNKGEFSINQILIERVN